jgi:hypothetical protein
MGLSTFPAGDQCGCIFFRELFQWCQKAVAIDHEHETKGESEEK